MLKRLGHRLTSLDNLLPERRPLVVLFVCLVSADLSGLLLLHGSPRAAFMNGYEAIVAAMCAVSCILAIRNSKREYWVWAMIASAFLLQTFADLHDLLRDISVVPLVQHPLLDMAGWWTRIPIAMAILFPTVTSILPQRSRLPWIMAVLDFLQSSLAICLAFYCFIYLPHVASGTPWTVITKGDVVRDLTLAAGLLFRMLVEPSARLRRSFQQIGGLAVAVLVLRHLMPGYWNIGYAVLRPSLFLVMGYVALQWKNVKIDDSLISIPRFLQLRFGLTVIATANLVIAQMLAPVAMGGWRAQTYAISAISGLVYLVRQVVANHYWRGVEGELRNSFERLKAAFKTGPDAFFMSTLDEGRILEANDRFSEMFGIPLQEVIGKTSLELGFYGHPERRKVLVSKVLSQSFIRDYEASVSTRSGKQLIVQASASVLNASGEQFLLWVLRDITQQKRVEREVAETATEWQNTFDAIRDMVMLLDKDFRVTRANQAACAYFNATNEQLIGRHCYELMYGGSQPSSLYPLVKALQSKSHEEAELQIGDRWLSVSVDPTFDANGEVAKMVHVVRDITGRKSLEEQFLQAQKMEAVGQLAGGVAHDFNNLLGVILGYTELSLDDESLPESERSHLSKIKAAASRAGDITRQLLAFSRMEAFRPRAMNLNERIQETEKLLVTSLGENIRLETTLAPDLGTVMADSTGIDQIILNLVVNARDAMPKGGRIRVETANRTLDEIPEGATESTPQGYVVLTVSDTGSGIDPRIQKRIFEPFFTTKERGRGTGLGLSTVYGIVEQCHGRIEVHSRLGEGTTFTIYFPRVEAEADTSDSAAIESIRKGSETILLVEDDPALRALNVEVLTMMGYGVVEAGNGDEALARVEEHTGNMELLLTDISMPGMNGLQLWDRVSKLRPEMRVLFLSGYSEDLIESSTLINRWGFLQKPVPAKVLARKIREVLDSEIAQNARQD